MMILSELDDWIQSKEFGSGAANPIAYSTAWVAMIRDRNEPMKPAFPQSLQWLRDNQLNDGSWGSKHPKFIYDRILSTIASVLCLKQYNMDCDSKRIENGIFAAKQYLYLLSINGINKNNMSAGFEMILPTLIDKSTKMGIDYLNHDLIDTFRTEKMMKLYKISECEKMLQKFTNVAKPWYCSLEALDDIYDQKTIASIVDPINHMIGSSYSATAFALTNNNNLMDCMQPIERAVFEHKGGVPSTYRMDVFDLAWSINFLVMAGYDVRKPILENSINKLVELWQTAQGMVGGCVGLPPDADDIANTIFALTSVNKMSKSVNELKTLLKFYRNNYFITFESERHPSISTNINCLIALNKFRHIDSVNEIIANVYEWLKCKIIQNDFNFEDKWHYSPLYSMTRSMFAFEFIDKAFCETLFQILINKQNSDGGWGVEGLSTAEETAYVVMAICHWNRVHYNNNNENVIECMRRAKQFLAVNDDIHALWIDKTLYCPVSVVKTAIYAAKYALEQFNDL